MLETNIELDKSTILITGAAGFIGASLAQCLLKSQKELHIIGLDDLNNYYDISLKEYRLNQIKLCAAESQNHFMFIKGSIADKALVEDIFTQYNPQVVVNLAAQAGVRYSIENPDAYIESNLIGFYNILESCRHSLNDKPEEKRGIKHLIYASSSSVYGNNTKIPYSTEDPVNYPVSLYAATKKSNELLAYAYSKLYGIPSTGLRFFTVYGPAGRPDMAYFKFTEKLVKRQKIQIYNYGNCQRDFTYIDDIVTGVQNIMKHSPILDKTGVPYKLYNIGNCHPENLLNFIEILQDELKRAEILPKDYDFEQYKEFIGMQPGDVEITYADITELEKDFCFHPATELREGLRKFVEWYKMYHSSNPCTSN